jgi:proline racemase
MSMIPSPCLHVIDMHTAGEPVRIFGQGYPELKGATILDKRRQALAQYDHLRTALIHEPRGHAGMYGVIPVRPSLEGADIAALFCHASGYSTMCGHATIAIGRWAVDSGQVPHDGTRAQFGLELPCGLVQVEVTLDEGRVIGTAFESVPAFIEKAGLHLDLPQFGMVTCDIVFGGAYYAILSTGQLGLSFEAGLPRLTAAATEVFAAARQALTPQHPSDADLSFLYGVILTDDAAPDRPSRNLCLFGESQIDRSPTGSGVTARMALDVLSGRLAVGQKREISGPTDEAFTGMVTRRTQFHGRPAVHVKVAGHAFYSGSAQFILEAEDPLQYGFLLET